MSSYYIVEPYVSIKSNSVVRYSKVVYSNLIKRYDMPISNLSVGLSLSSKSARRLQEVIRLLFLATKSKKVYSLADGRYYSFKLNFITLTLSSNQIHVDSDILKLCFEPFLRILRRSHVGLLYVWKAEVQDNGNIHFHLNTNIFIHYRTLRDLWNQCQEKLGYVSNCSVMDPNSTDVKVVKSERDMAKYMAGYIAKKDVYKKSLRRYIRRYNRLFSILGFSVLPFGYHARCLKRCLNIKRWGCSKALQGISCSIPESMLDYSNLEELEVVGNPILLDFAKVYTNVNFQSPGLEDLNQYHTQMLQSIRDYEKNLIFKYYV
jgi:hypothetical protein